MSGVNDIKIFFYTPATQTWSFMFSDFSTNVKNTI